MISRHGLVWLVLFGLIAAPVRIIRADEPAAEPPKSSAADPAKEKADKQAADKQAAKDEEEFYDLYKSLADTVDQVDRNYVKKVDRRELMEAAIKGVLSKLDPYSSYIGPSEAGHFKDTVENQFGGIGIQITMDESQLKILSPLVGTPGYKAGLLAGDKIVKIGDESTANLSLDEAVGKLKGDAGTSITLSVIHPGTAKPEAITVTREVIHIDTVLGDKRRGDDSWDFMFDGEKRIGYIRITTFSRDTAQDLKKAMDELKAHKLRGLVIDLRFNPGGLLTSAIDTCDMFLTEGRIVSTEGRSTPKKVWDATKKADAYTGFPLAILVNRYSASASEIVSACLQDHNRAVIIGERTWGKGSVQNVIELEDGKSLLKLTTASYQRPNGHNIHRFPDSKDTDEWGVSPSPGYEIKLSDAEMAEFLADRRDRDIVAGKKSGKTADAKAAAKHGADRQLQKAIDYLTTELAKAP
ncbi:MAG TPA: S41 family peptidase [Pirellulales bacterium]|jgi:carboxyl-terminal processing protease|nr:S41 family peptidase [Pirellulales bacterium]